VLIYNNIKLLFFIKIVLNVLMFNAY